MPKICFSYVRFSTAEQAKGDSLRRQMEQSRKYATEHDLILDESLKPDRGISAYHGKNRTEGNLAAFLARIKDGSVPKASILLVESLDRLSREEVEEALYQFLDIIRSGIEVRTLSDGAVYRKGALKTEQLMLSLFVMARAHGESAAKAERIGASWMNKRHHANGKKAMSERVPAWLIAEKGQPISVRSERAKIVRQIYEWAAQGLGQYQITDKLISANVPAWGPVYKGRPPRWTPFYVADILRSEKVLGHYQPMTKVRIEVDPETGEKRRVALSKRVDDGPLVKDYYPQVISYDLWRRVQEVRRAFAQTKFGKSLHAGKNKFSDKNLFRKLIFDADNRAPMVFRDYIGHPCLVTTHRKDLRSHKIAYPVFESAVLDFLSSADWDQIANANVTPEDTRLKERSETLAKAIVDNERVLSRYESLLDDPDTKDSERVQARYKAAIKEAARLKVQRDTLQAELDAASSNRKQLIETTGAEFRTSRRKLKTEERLKVRLRIAERVERIDAYFGTFPFTVDGAQLEGHIVCIIRFINGALRGIVLHGEDVFLMHIAPKTAEKRAVITSDALPAS